IYRGTFEIAVPYTRTAAADRVELEIGLQGCADIGLCYPPQSWTREVELPPAPARNASAILPSPRGDDLLPVDDAFVMNARFDGPNLLAVSWTIEPGYYLYADKLEIETEGGIQLGVAEWPQGVPHRDDNFGDVLVFYDYVEAQVPFSRAGPEEIPVTVRGRFQGCRENSICYPPSEQTMALVLPAASAFAPAESAPPSASDAPVSE